FRSRFFMCSYSFSILHIRSSLAAFLQARSNPAISGPAGKNSLPALLYTLPVFFKQSANIIPRCAAALESVFNRV
ncbi:hypothetical protein, partial [Bacillus cabrialesii]|uniref:hypothetical protein n=1 Tax=Bacillus cabrialesii TaxID=2487276 RepID=UPI001C03D558